MTEDNKSPTDDELAEFEELARLYDPRASMAEQWAEDLGDAVRRLVAEVRHLRRALASARTASISVASVSDDKESRKIHENAIRLLSGDAKTAAPPQGSSPSLAGGDHTWGRAVARAAAWVVIAVVIVGFVVAFPSLLAVLVVVGLLGWAIRVLIRTSRPRPDGKA